MNMSQFCKISCFIKSGHSHFQNVFKVSLLYDSLLNSVLFFGTNDLSCVFLNTNGKCQHTNEQEHASWANYQILERRSNLGGTWDFFKYPGIRSDSDMFTFGFSWKIWRSAEPIATGCIFGSRCANGQHVTFGNFYDRRGDYELLEGGG